MIKQKVIQALFDEVGLNKREARDLADIYFKEAPCPIEYAWSEIKDQQDRFPQLIGKDLVMAAAVAIRIARNDPRYKSRSLGEACLLGRHVDVERFLKGRNGDLDETDLYWTYSSGEDQIIGMCEARCKDENAKASAMNRAAETAVLHHRGDLIDKLLARGAVLKKEMLEKLLESNDVEGFVRAVRLARQYSMPNEELFELVIQSLASLGDEQICHPVITKTFDELAQADLTSDLIQPKCDEYMDNWSWYSERARRPEFSLFIRLGWRPSDVNAFHAAILDGEADKAREMLREGRAIDIDSMNYGGDDELNVNPPGKYDDEPMDEFTYKRQCLTCWASAFAGGHRGVINMLLEEGLPLNLPFELDNDPLEVSPLGLALYSCDDELIQTLIDHEASSAPDANQIQTQPISIAVAHGRKELVKLLLAHGADPLHGLKVECDDDLANLLLAHFTKQVDGGRSVCDLPETYYRSLFVERFMPELRPYFEKAISSGESVGKVFSVVPSQHRIDLVLPQIAHYYVGRLPEKDAIEYLQRHLKVSIPVLLESKQPGVGVLLARLIRSRKSELHGLAAEFPVDINNKLKSLVQEEPTANERDIPEALFIPPWHERLSRPGADKVELLPYEFTVAEEGDIKEALNKFLAANQHDSIRLAIQPFVKRELIASDYFTARKRVASAQEAIQQHPEERNWSDVILHAFLTQSSHSEADGRLDEVSFEFMKENTLADIYLKASDETARLFLKDYILRNHRGLGLSSIAAQAARWGDLYLKTNEKEPWSVQDEEIHPVLDKGKIRFKESDSGGWRSNWYEAYRCRISYREQFPLHFWDYRSPKLLPVEEYAELEAAPEVASIGLFPIAMGPAGYERHLAENGLAWLHDHGHGTVVCEVAKRYGPEAEEALARILAYDRKLELPWPAQLPKWIGEVPTPVLKSGGSLSRTAVENLARMVSIQVEGEPYPLLMNIVESCTEDSLESFAIGLLDEWAFASYPSAYAWVTRGLCCFGRDKAIARIATAVNVISKAQGRSERNTALKRIKVLLEVLSQIGSPPALLQLGMFAHRGSFQKLRDLAKKIFAEAAARKGFNEEDLADQLVPDFGLSADGRLELDYGTRRFQVSFNEKLEPQLEDEGGTPVSMLPRKRRDDDPDKAKAAITHYKKLRKDVAAWSGVLIKRLEQAMLEGRRWPVAVFLEHFAHHPLVQHLVRRQVWAIYTGDTLSQTFRLAEDASFADQEDREISLPDNATIGLPHPLDLEESAIAAWQQIFADYEILPAISQLGRDVYVPDAQERQATISTKLKGISARPKVLYGALTGRGWKSNDYIGQFGDLIVNGFRRNIRGSEVELKLEHDGYLERDDDLLVVERLESKVPFGELPPVLYSEVMRDLMAFKH